MKEYLYYLILFLGFSALLSEIVNSFEETKLSYATFYNEQYFEAEELKDTVSYPSGGTSTGYNLNVYKGYLVKNKAGGTVSGFEKTIHEMRLKNGNIPVWFGNIRGVSKLVFRTKSTPPNKPFFKIYFYIFCWVGSIYSIICLIKLNNEK